MQADAPNNETEAERAEASMAEGQEEQEPAGEALTSNPEAERPPKSALKDKLWSPTFVLIIVLIFVGYMVNQGLNTGTSVYLSYIGETAALAGIGAAVFSISGGFARLFGGKTIDSKGRAKCIIFGMGMMVVTTIAPVLDYTGAAFVILRILQGIGFGLATTAVMTAAADVLPLSRLNEGIGYSGLGQALATSVGPAFALTLVATEPHTNLFLGLFAFVVLGFALSFLLRYEKNPQILPKCSTYRLRWEEMRRANAESVAIRVTGSAEAAETPENPDAGSSTESANATDKPIATAAENTAEVAAEPKGWRKYIEPSAMPGAIPILVFSPCMGFMIYFGGLFGESMGLGNVGLFFTISAITMILIRVSSKAFMNTVPPIAIMSVAVIASLAAYAIFVALSVGVFGDASRMVFFANGILYGIAAGLATPINQAVAVGNSSAARWGAANAAFLLAFDIGIGFSCILWGVLSDAFGFAFVLCCIMAFLAASWIAAFFLYPKRS